MSKYDDADSDPQTLDPMKDEPRTLSAAKVMIGALRAKIAKASLSIKPAAPSNPTSKPEPQASAKPTPEQQAQAVRHMHGRPVIERAAFDLLTQQERHDYIMGGGKLVDKL